MVHKQPSQSEGIPNPLSAKALVTLTRDLFAEPEIQRFARLVIPNLSHGNWGEAIAMLESMRPLLKRSDAVTILDDLLARIECLRNTQRGDANCAKYLPRLIASGRDDVAAVLGQKLDERQKRWQNIRYAPRRPQDSPYAMPGIDGQAGKEIGISRSKQYREERDRYYTELAEHFRQLRKEFGIDEH